MKLRRIALFGAATMAITAFSAVPALAANHGPTVFGSCTTPADGIQTGCTIPGSDGIPGDVLVIRHPDKVSFQVTTNYPTNAAVTWSVTCTRGSTTKSIRDVGQDSDLALPATVSLPLPVRNPTSCSFLVSDGANPSVPLTGTETMVLTLIGTHHGSS